jgi:hypothetical protein
MIDIACLKVSKSRRFAVTSGCASKNGMMIPFSSARRLIEYRKRFAVVVSASLNDDSPTAEVLSHQLEGLHRSERLGDRELVLDLPAEAAPCVLHDRDREAAFTIGEAGYPLRGTWPFLLIARTEQIVTAHSRPRISDPCDTKDEYCRILGFSSI